MAIYLTTNVYLEFNLSCSILITVIISLITVKIKAAYDTCRKTIKTDNLKNTKYRMLYWLITNAYIKWMQVAAFLAHLMPII